MIKIRLNRQGKRNDPFYKIVAIESFRKKGGKYIDALGFYNPSTNEIQIDKDKLKGWVKKGAQISPAVKKLLDKK